jgi:GT2 family glycosyltransferase
MTNPLVSIIILNWNGKKWLERCLPTVEKILYKPLEIIVVNNGSTDDSAQFLKDNYPDIKVIEIKKNAGFAGANNIGVKSAKGKYVLLLNNDTEVDPSFLKPLVVKMERDNAIGAVQPELRNMTNKNLIDSIGSFFTFTGFLYHYGYFQEYKKDKYKKELSVYSVKGACFLMRKKEYLGLGGLDEDFVCYVEESDLCHRILLSGKKIISMPQSFIYHFGGGDMSIMTKSELTIFRSFRNRVISYLKNLSIDKLILVLPLHLLLSEALILASILRGKVKQAIASQLGLFGWIPMFPSILKKRKYIQNKIRKISDSEIFNLVEHNPNVSYYFHFFFNPEGKFEEKEI